MDRFVVEGGDRTVLGGDGGGGGRVGFGFGSSNLGRAISREKNSQKMNGTF